MVLEVAKAERTLGLKRGEYAVCGIDEAKGIVRLEDERGRQHAFRPARMQKADKDGNLVLFERRELEIHRSDQIRWTRNDHQRGLLNADRAKVVSIERGRLTVETSKGEQLQLKQGDPMLKRIDLAYALNAHMAQGLTSDRGIAVMDSRERNLSNQQTFLVTATRLRDHLTLVVDSAAKLAGAVARNKGEKASALEVIERLRNAAAIGVSKGLGEQPGRDTERELSREKTRAIDIGI
jgi:ATP-dependent exoDNAse (exonuclease V) alpha subunit